MILIQERKQSGLLYHYTSVDNMLSILEDDDLKASEFSDGSSAISFTRDKNFEKTPGRTVNSMQVRMVFDGDKLSDKYKIEPYSYFYFHPSDSEAVNPVTDLESEERIVGIPQIDRVSRYLVRIEIRRRYHDTTFYYYPKVTKAYYEIYETASKEEKLRMSTDLNQNKRIDLLPFVDYIKKKYRINCMIKL